METYTFLRQVADSWALLLLFLFFVGVFFWAWRPGSRPLHDDAADVPFRHDDDVPDVRGRGPRGGTGAASGTGPAARGPSTTFGGERQ